MRIKWSTLEGILQNMKVSAIRRHFPASFDSADMCRPNIADMTRDALVTFPGDEDADERYNDRFCHDNQVLVIVTWRGTFCFFYYRIIPPVMHDGRQCRSEYGELIRVTKNIAYPATETSTTIWCKGE